MTLDLKALDEHYAGRTVFEGSDAQVVWRMLTALRATRRALENTVDSLECVDSAHPGVTGYGVREERIIDARAALALAVDE